jgi:hypothetical protein
VLFGGVVLSGFAIAFAIVLAVVERDFTPNFKAVRSIFVMPATTPTTNNTANHKGEVCAYLSMNQPTPPHKPTIAASSKPIFMSGAISRSPSLLGFCGCEAICLHQKSVKRVKNYKAYKINVETYIIKQKIPDGAIFR